MTKGGFVFIASIGFVAASACSSGNHTPVADAGGPTATCGSNVTVEDQSEKDCTTCSAGMVSCSNAQPLKACCTWTGQPRTPLARSTGLHRFSAPQGASSAPDLSCLTNPGMRGASTMVTLTGYVWLFSSGTDSAGVKVQVYEENNPNTDGSLGMPVGMPYTTTMSDMADPTPTTWDTNCPNGCSYRQYTITGIPTETPLIIETSDAANGSTWATLYDYNIYFPNSAVTMQGGVPTVRYDATAASSGDPNTVALSVGFTVTSGVIAGEVHDCSTDPDGPVTGVRLSGATVGTSVAPQDQIFYSTSDESSPLLDRTATSTTDLSLFAGVNYPTGVPIRVTAVGEDPANPGKFLMLGTYVVQAYPSAVTAISLRGRRPWQP